MLQEVLMGDAPLLQPDTWLGEMMGKPTYRLAFKDTLAQDIEASKDLAASLQKSVFVYTKIPTEHTECIPALQRLGFTLVDTLISFQQVSPPVPLANPSEIRWAQTDDESSVVELARRSFQRSRFHLDPKISETIANRIKAEWVRNYFSGARGEKMVIATKNGNPVGFIQVLRNACNVTIDLIAVDPSTRKQGIAGNMIAFLMKHLGAKDTLHVGTQVSNVASVRLYEKLGFRLQSSQYIFHYHHE